VISVQVGSQVSGIVQSLSVDFNSVVKQGQAIAQIDPAPFRAKLEQARASLKTARGNLTKARVALAQRKLDLDRMASLQREQFVGKADLDQAETNYRDALAQVEVSQAQVDQAQAAVASAELDLEHTTIYSPVNGIVVSRNVDVGQTVAASLQAPTLFVIAQDLTKMQVEANVSESDIGGVAEGQSAEFTVDAYPNEPFKGTVVQVRNAPISIQNVVTYDVVIGVDNRGLKLKPGMTANVSIVTARKDQTLRVPSAALRFKLPGTPTERKKSVVWKLDAKAVPQAVPITPGIADPMFTEVVEGDLREGDAVIVGIEEAGGPGQKELPPGFGVGPRMR
jgi:HlyD family secretion protein